MQVYELGERVRVSVPRATDPDHRYHGEVDRIVAVRRGGLAAATNDPGDAWLYRVAFEAPQGNEMLFRHADLTAISAAAATSA